MWNLQAATAFARRARDSVIDLGRRRMAREAIWVMAGHGAVAMAGLASLRLFTELAPRSTFGAANLLIGMLTLMMQALLAPILQTQIRYHVSYRDAGDDDRYTRLIALLAACITLAVIAIMALALLVWPNARGDAGRGVVGWLAVWIGITAYRAVLINQVHAERQQKRYAFWLAAEAVLMMSCTAAALFIWPTVEAYIAGQAGGTAIAAFAFGRLPARPYAAISVRTAPLCSEAWRQIVSYGLPFAALALVNWLSNLCDRYVLALNLDMAVVGQCDRAGATAFCLPMDMAPAWS